MVIGRERETCEGDFFDDVRDRVVDAPVLVWRTNCLRCSRKIPELASSIWKSLHGVAALASIAIGGCEMKPHTPSRATVSCTSVYV